MTSKQSLALSIHGYIKDATRTKATIPTCLTLMTCLQIMVAIAEKQRRPSIPPESELPGGSFLGLPVYLELMEACWHAEAEERPSFESCIITLRGLLEQAMAVK